MNDDRKFKERAELMKQLFMVRISSDVIAKVVGVSESTVTHDRVRVAKMFGIKIPTVANSNVEKAERFKFLFFYYCKSDYKSDRDPLIRAIKLTINIEKIENYLYSMETLWNELRMPQISSDYSFADNYRELLERCHSFEKRDLVNEFYQAIADGVISCDSFRWENDVIETAIKFFSCSHREEINSYVITNPKEYFEPLFFILTEREYVILASYYGLDCKKLNLIELSNKFGLSKERIRQIFEKAIRKISVKLVGDGAYLINNSTRIDNLEKENKDLKEKYNNLSRESDERIVKLETENQALLQKIQELDINAKFPSVKFMRPAIEFLIKDIRDTGIGIRIKNGLFTYDIVHVVDIVEFWQNIKLKKLRTIGKKAIVELEEFFEYSGFNVENFKAEDIALAKRVLKRTSY